MLAHDSAVALLERAQAKGAVGANGAAGVDPRAALAQGLRANYLLGGYTDSGQDHGVTLPRPGDSEPLVLLGVGTEPSGVPRFSPGGAPVAWGSADGTVFVCSPEQVRQRLAAVGLGW